MENTIKIRVRLADGTSIVKEYETPVGVDEVLEDVGMSDESLAYRFRANAEGATYRRVFNDEALTESGTLSLSPVAKSQ